MNAIRFKRWELSLLSAKEYDNPFLDVEVDATFTHTDGTVVTIPGFWNGGNEWKVRFLSEKAGVWHYVVTCSTDDPTLCAEGDLTVEDAAPATELEKHGFVKLEKGKRYMTYGDGKPFFWLGDTHWQMPDYERLHECNYPGCTCGNQFRHLVDDRVKKGFTVYQTYFDAAESDGGGNKTVHHWWKEKYTLINPAAFNETMDVMIEYLASQGLTVAMGFGVHYGTPRAYGQTVEEQLKPMLAFARYCVARYACYPLVWITAQEITVTPEIFRAWKEVGALVGRLDGFHRPNGAHQYVHFAEEDAITALDSEPWHQWWTLQAGHGGVSRLKPRSFYRGYRELASGKPYFETECQYEDITCGAFCGDEASRMGAWNALLSGCGGFTYGATGVWAMGWDQKNDIGWLPYSPEPWFVGMDKPGSTEMTYMRRFFEYVGWPALEPEFDYKYGAFELRRYVSVAHRGDTLLIYYFFGEIDETATGRLTDLRPGTSYQARWFDPIHGAFIDLPAIETDENGCAKAPDKPSPRDWALLLTLEDLGPYETEEYPAYLPTLAPSQATPGEEIPVQSISVTGCEDGHEGEKMLDGDPETYWTGFAAKVSQTIVADMGENKRVGWFYLSVPKDQPLILLRYRVYGSRDGKKYELISERAYHGRVGLGGPYPEFYDQLSGEYRYIKLYISSSDIPDKLCLNRFALFAPKA